MATEPNPNPPAGGTPPAGGNPPAGGTPPAPGVTPEQLHQAIEKARLEERDKLRTKLDQAESKAASLETKLAEQTTQLQKLTDQLSTLQASLRPEGGVDVQKAIEQAAQAASAQLGKEYSAKMAELEKALEAERGARQTVELERTKSRLIAQAGGETALIPELVRGSNEEEIQASIAESKLAFQRILAKAGGQPPTQHPSNGTGAPPTIPAAPAGGGAGGGEPPIPSSVRGMPLSEYAKIRQNLKKQAAARYPTQVITQ